MLSVCRSFNERRKALLTNAPNSQKRGSIVKTAVFGVSSSLPPLLDRGGNLVWSADEKTPLFSSHFDAKQCRNSFQKPYSCDSCTILSYVAFRSNFVCSLPLNLDSYGENDPDGMFRLFCNQVA